MSYYGYDKNGLYRSRDGMVAGVCQGTADFLDISSFWVRAAVVFMGLCTGFWPTLFLYIVAAMVMKKEPYVNWS